MTWDEFKSYFDSHLWIRVPSMRAEVCYTCDAIRIDLEHIFRNAVTT